jgi:hypothetical protein
MELQARYEAIQRREEELRRREGDLRKQNVTVDNVNAPNFPPFYPVMYHNIAEEIPIAMQWFLKIALIAIAILIVNAVLNLISAFTSKSFKEDSKTSEVAQNVIFGAIIGILTGPLAFRVTYMREYRQFKGGDITLWTLALQALLFAWVAFCSVGIYGVGTVGVIMTIDAVSGKSSSGFVKALAGITCGLWLLSAAIELFLLGRLLLLYKGSGPRIEAGNPAGAYSPAPQ